MEYISLDKVNYSINKFQILKDLSIDIKAGGFYSILGPNGSGKSTLLKAIIKAIDVNEGNINIEGKSIDTIKAKEMAKNISFVSQNSNITSPLTCYEIVMMARYHKLRLFQNESIEDRKAVLNAMEEMEVIHLKDKLITEISGGERQRVIFARAIAQETDCIILDEPISNLDIHYQIKAMDILKKLNKLGKTIIIVLHDLNFALNYSNFSIIVQDGEVFKFGRTKDVLTEENIKRVYLTKNKIITLNDKRFIIFI